MLSSQHIPHEQQAQTTKTRRGDNRGAKLGTSAARRGARRRLQRRRRGWCDIPCACQVSFNCSFPTLYCASCFVEIQLQIPPDAADTYSREARSLPFYKRVEPPAAYIEIQRPFAKNSAIEVASDRHPALPRESWEVVNAAHFRAYKAQIAKHWPPSPPLECPYPSPPNIEDEEGWKAYIGGADEDGGDDEDGEEDAMDEEAAMNAPPKPARPRQAREPLVSLLAELDTVSSHV